MRHLLLACCLLPAIHAGDAPLLSADFEGDPAGYTCSSDAAATTEPDQVLAGKRSLRIDTRASTTDWHEAFNSVDGVVPPNTTFELRFDYRWLEKPTDGFLYCLLRSRSDAKRDMGWTEKRYDEFRGRDGVVRRVLTSGGSADYRLIIGVGKQGAVLIDNVSIRVITPSTVAPPESVGPPAGGHWVKVPEFCDEFEGDRLDLAKWQPGNGGWQGRAPAYFDPRNLSVADGRLNLWLKRADYATDPALQKLPKVYHTWTSASVRTKQMRQYGFFEIRAKPVMATASSAFWFTNEGAEIDMFEIGGSAPAHAFTVHSTVHVFPQPWNDSTPHWARGSSWDLDQRPVDAFHIYSLQWDAQRIVMRIDGNMVAEFANTHWHRPMPVIFDIETMPDWFGLPQDGDQLPTSFQIDWIRTWRQE